MTISAESGHASWPVLWMTKFILPASLGRIFQASPLMWHHYFILPCSNPSIFLLGLPLAQGLRARLRYILVWMCVCLLAICITITFGEWGAIVMAVCNFRYWMFGSCLSAYCTSPYRRVWTSELRFAIRSYWETLDVNCFTLHDLNEGGMIIH